MSSQTTHAHMRPTTYKHQTVTNLPVRSVSIDDAFWAPKLKVLRDTTVHDVLNKFEQDGALRNFDFVAAGAEGYHSGEPWFDGLLYETLRGISDILAVHDDEALDRRVDEIAAKIAAAQDAVGDGYINTYTLLDRPTQRWGENGGNLRWQHDVYNAGCLIEAGVHHYRATGKTSLLAVAVKFANHMSGLMGPPPKRNIVPAHSLPEEAVLKLHQLAVDEPGLADTLNLPFAASDYLALAAFWIHNRGNHEGRASHDGEYAQDHKPVLEQDEAVGHAVRATLLYAGLTSLHLATGEAAYLETAKKLWDNIAYRKSHITGGVGAIHHDEKFGGEYELPDNGYLETCAGVGVGFFSWNLFLATGESRYIDKLETILYNIVLAGRSMNGHKYFYENPLVSDGGHNRWEWHACPCCPPMIVKLLPELASYVYAQDGNGVYVNLFIASEGALRVGDVPVRLKQQTLYPWDGAVAIAVTPEREARFDVRVRIPEWCARYAIAVNGQEAAYDAINGYAVLTRTWAKGDVIRLDLELSVDLIGAHPKVTTHANRAAIRRGPVLYCLESMDNERYAGGVANYAREALDKQVRLNRRLPPTPVFETRYDPDFFDGAVIIRTEDADGHPLTAIPYPYWNNRSRGTMDIWLAYDHAAGTEGWDDRLYRTITRA
ncbi:glycoside hydrolase family 127 protein [Paenibacillus glycinis]|uniref:Glycoside hydrolase family 127 protein n=1 Tax=Paenibacillus glycinis TaxID=2697035 RepID=A0ABW9XSL2_9BACL|nr:beta-L-arabinofuranosidase domain-containing protein [Paenibacillus glycinis]NBD25652.1 glycoside hydrolase family 127 protein [Paenibacillus glycinis]